jgi:hypothetical protein
MSVPRRPLLRLPILAAVLSAAAPAGALDFEGTIEMRMTHGDTGKAGTARTLVSKLGTRMEMSTEAGQAGPVQLTTLVLKSAPTMVYMVNDAKKTYVEFDSSRLERPDAAAKEHRWTAKRTGTEKVAGYDCIKGEVTRDDGETWEISTTRALGGFEGFWRGAASGPRAERAAAMVKALKEAGLDGWPLKLVMHRKNEQGATTWEVTRVTRGSPPADLFSLSGYKKTEGMAGAMQLTPEQQQKMEKAQQQMQDAMKNMTPEQRTQMEQMMKGMGPPSGQ